MNKVLWGGAYLLGLTLVIWVVLIIWAKYQAAEVIQQASRQMEEAMPESTPPANELMTTLAAVSLPSTPRAAYPTLDNDLNTSQKVPIEERLPTAHSAPSAEDTVSESTEKVTPQPVTEVTQTKTETQTQPSSVSSQQIYAQLSENASLSIQLAWPVGHSDREELFTYLYQCVGAELALLQGQALTIVSPQRYQTRSQWLRVAQGEMGRQEKRWLRAANAPGTPVRLVPESLDYNLANHIASALNQPGSTQQLLHALRGRYELSGKQLYLVDIQLNGETVKPKWLLHTGDGKTAC